MVANGHIGKFGKLIADAEIQTIARISDGRLETEPSITDRLLTEIENKINSSQYDGITFRARTLRDKGANAPEKIYGADICSVLDIELPNFKIKKGFLCQSKRTSTTGIRIVNGGQYGRYSVEFPNGRSLANIKEQTKKMLEVSPDSFIWIYSERGIVVVPASSVSGLRTSRIAAVHGKSLDRFFKEYLMCFIGDQKLNDYGDTTLEKLKLETKARNVLLFTITTEK